MQKLSTSKQKVKQTSDPRSEVNTLIARGFILLTHFSLAQFLAASALTTILNKFTFAQEKNRAKHLKF